MHKLESNAKCIWKKNNSYFLTSTREQNTDPTIVLFIASLMFVLFIHNNRTE